MFENLDNSSIQSCTIFKVNVWQRESNPDVYTSKMVSIGSIRRREENGSFNRHKGNKWSRSIMVTNKEMCKSNL
ncbi:hypothetical protein H5410_019918 [Solanum commersonii]|uniref:Uncharacterized protein n=1 Tax=Solanum commersonii TaxID=4109 RepID=A0A9J5Z8P8_SOLCO|nr:hypothetical protein H5410_019918 [Solanum commersonii]